MKLSTFETIYLRWASQGRSLLETAVIEGVDAEHVQTNLDRMLTALMVSSVAEAISKATDRKII